ncbi:MGMT family protein, partial [Bacillus vallismortis]|nr:MGMT family protein [Bacillus vallismortis]
AIGSAIGANPPHITLPCHRVIGKNGSLTGYRGGMEMNTRLLELERDFTNNGKELHFV